METVYRALRAIPVRRGPRRWVGGVCAGLADRFGWDANIVRLVTLVSFLLPVLGIGAYLVLWLIVPWVDNSLPLQRIVRSFRGR